jgi:hypothetical protein
LSRLKTLFQKAGYYRHLGGSGLLISRVLTFIIAPVFRYESYYLLQKSLMKQDVAAEPQPKIEGVTLKIITSVNEVNQLDKEGYDIRKYAASAEFMDKMDEELEAGGILFGSFIGYNLVSTGWAYINERSMNLVSKIPVQIDFTKEAFEGGRYTLPEYRGSGLNPYILFHLFKYLQGKGIIAVNAQVLKSNSSSLAVGRKAGYRIYGEIRLIKFLTWKTWKQKLYKEVK